MYRPTTRTTAVFGVDTRGRRSGMTSWVSKLGSGLLLGVGPVPTSEAESGTVLWMRTNTTKTLGQRHAYEYTRCDDAKKNWCYFVKSSESGKSKERALGKRLEKIKIRGEIEIGFLTRPISLLSNQITVCVTKRRPFYRSGNNEPVPI